MKTINAKSLKARIDALVSTAREDRPRRPPWTGAQHMTEPQPIADRIAARAEYRAKVEALYAAGRVDDAVRIVEEQIEPLNEWLLARGVW
jgi:hypothetical protein